MIRLPEEKFNYYLVLENREAGGEYLNKIGENPEKHDTIEMFGKLETAGIRD